MSLFLSYNSEDRAAAEALAEHLRKAGAEVFFDRWQLPGMEWPQALEHQLDRCDAVVVVVGPHGLGGWQKREVYVALNRGMGEDLTIVPVLLPGSEPPLGFLALRTWVDLRRDPTDPVSLALLEAAVGTRALSESQKEAQRRTRATICPYRGLLAFREEDSTFFFGRELEVGRLRNALKRHPFVTVVGPSGCGKSSLVRAGLIPLLRQEPSPIWEISILQPREDPLKALAALCWPLLEDVDHLDELRRAEWIESFAARVEKQPDRWAASVERILEKQAGSDRLLLVVDQAEELFTTSAAAPREAFLEALTTAPAKVPFSVVLTLRAEFVGVALENAWLGDAIHESVLLLQPMAHEALEAVIRKPAAVVEMDIDPHLPELIVRDVEGEPGHLPLLEFALTELWKRSGGRRLRTSDYKAFGGVRNVIAHRAEALYGELSVKDAQGLREALLQMVEAGAATATRRLALRSELPQEALPIIQRFIDARLLVSGYSREKNEATVEVAHEALLTRWTALNTWIEEAREHLLWQQRLRAAQERWESLRQPRALLWSGGHLAEAGRWVAERPKLARNEFLRQSFRARQQTRYALLVVAVVIVALAAAAVGYGLRAVANESKLQGQAVLASARAQQDPAVAGLLLVSLGKDNPVGLSLGAIGLASAVAREPKSNLRLPHPSYVFRASFSSDSRRIVTASEDGTVRIWRTDRADEPVLLQGHTGSVWSASFSSDDRKVVSASSDGTVRIWSVDRASNPLVLEGHTEVVNCASFSSDDQRVVSASEDGTVRVWNADGTGSAVVLKGHTEGVNCASFSSDDQRVVSASEDGTVRVWRSDGSGTPLVYESNARINSASFSSDNRRVVAAASNGVVWIWSTEHPAAPIAYRAHTAPVWSAEFSTDNTKVVSASGDGTVRIWHADGTGVPIVLEGHTGPVWGARFNADGRKVISASDDGTVRIWNADGTGAPIVLRGHSAGVNRASFSADDRMVASASDDGTLRVWTMERGSAATVLRGHARWTVVNDGGTRQTYSYYDAIYCASFSSDGKRVVSASEDRTVRVWRADGTGTPVVLSGHTGSVKCANFSNDDRRVVSASNDGTVRIWDVEGMGTPLVLKGHIASVNSASFSTDDQRVVSASYDGTVRIWNADGGGASIVLRGHTESVECASFSGDGQRVVSASSDGTVRIWNADGTGAPIVLEGHSLFVNCAWFSRDDSRVVSASGDETVRVWKADGTGKPVVLRGHTGDVHSARFSSDGNRVVSASEDGTVRIWNSDGTGTAIVLQGHADEVYSARFSDDDRRVVSASQDGTVRVWSADGSGEPLILEGHSGWVWSAEFSRNGRRVVSSSSDLTVRVWTTSWEELIEELDFSLRFCLTEGERRTYLFETPQQARKEVARCGATLRSSVAAPHLNVG